jgi:site-specific DNA recombinase
MSTALTADRLADDLFTAWVHESRPPQRHRGRQPPGRLRFAFYGRISTSGYQDEASSRQWQYDNAARLTAGHGSVVAEYFDTGYSRSLPWHQRPAAAQLLRDASAPNRDFDAVVIGEYERALPAAKPCASSCSCRRTASRCGCRRPTGRST